MNHGLPLGDSRQRALDRVEPGHVTPVMVTFPAVSRTVSCTVAHRAVGKGRLTRELLAGSQHEEHGGSARDGGSERRIGGHELLDRRAS